MSLSVLLVEDNPQNQELARDLLELAGHGVTLAGNAAECRALLVRLDFLPSIALLDIRLPDASGVDLLREMRQVPRFDAVPIVAVTAHALAADVARLLEAGFDSVITKPIDTRTFLGEVERCAREFTSNRHPGRA